MTERTGPADGLDLPPEAAAVVDALTPGERARLVEAVPARLRHLEAFV